MKKKDADEKTVLAMERRLRERLGGDLRLMPFETRSAKIVFRAEMASGFRFFVKLARTEKGKAQKKMIDELNLPFVPRILHIIPFDETRSIICQEWMRGVHVKPEDMTADQSASLIAATLSLQQALCSRHVMLPPRDVEGAFAVIQDFARRHPLMRPLLDGILSIPPDERTWKEMARFVIHGDQHYENYIFEGEDVNAIMDLEAVTTGLRTQDFAYIVMRRFYKARPDAEKRARLFELADKMFSACDASLRERLCAINMWRIIFAARRLEKHSRFGPVAFLVWKRDRPLRKLLDYVSRTA